MTRPFTIKDLQEKKAKGLIRDYQVVGKGGQLQIDSTPKKSKYGNNKVIIDNIEFDSQKEGDRYKLLKTMVKAGVISMLQLQVPYELNQGGTHSLQYIADFVYVETATGETIVEDVKGFRTKEYKKKRRLMKKVHNIKIKEI
jgi:hypothetical protein